MFKLTAIIKDLTLYFIFDLNEKFDQNSGCSALYKSLTGRGENIVENIRVVYLVGNIYCTKYLKFNWT